MGSWSDRGVTRVRVGQGRPGRPGNEVSGSIVGAAGDAGATVKTFLPMLFEAKVALRGSPSVSCWAKLAPKAGDEG